MPGCLAGWLAGLPGWLAGCGRPSRESDGVAQARAYVRPRRHGGPQYGDYPLPSAPEGGTGTDPGPNPVLTVTVV